MPIRFLLSAFVFATVASACSPSPDAQDASSQDAADSAVAQDAIPASDSAITCDSTSLDGVAAVTESQVAGDAPVSTGGTLADGTYVLTGLTMYNAPTGVPAVTMRSVLVFDGTTVQRADSLGGDGAAVQQRADRVDATGTSVTFTTLCPAASAQSSTSGSYTATGTTFTLSQTLTGSTVVVMEYTRR